MLYFYEEMVLDEIFALRTFNALNSFAQDSQQPEDPEPPDPGDTLPPPS